MGWHTHASDQWTSDSEKVPNTITTKLLPRAKIDNKSSLSHGGACHTGSHLGWHIRVRPNAGLAAWGDHQVSSRCMLHQRPYCLLRCSTHCSCKLLWCCVARCQEMREGTRRLGGFAYMYMKMQMWWFGSQTIQSKCCCWGVHLRSRSFHYHNHLFPPLVVVL